MRLELTAGFESAVMIDRILSVSGQAGACSRGTPEHGPIALIDMEGVWHGVYHPDEYLGKVILQYH